MSTEPVRALVIGGTRGLGRSLVRTILKDQKNFVEPVAVGRRNRQDAEVSGPDRLGLVSIRPSKPFLMVNNTQVRREYADVTMVASVEALMRKFTVEPSLNFQYLFYLPGMRLQGTFVDQTPTEINQAFDIQVIGLMNIIRYFHKMKKRPYHLVVVTSTTSYKIRSNEAVYGAAKAAQAQFTRNFHQELEKSHPGSKTLIVHCGGMQTEFWKDSGVDTSKFMDPNRVAEIIWDEVKQQGEAPHFNGRPALHEIKIERDSEGNPVKDCYGCLSGSHKPK